MFFKGEMPEWSIGAVSKTVVPFWNRGFESLSLRQSISGETARSAVSFFKGQAVKNLFLKGLDLKKVHCRQVVNPEML